MSQHITLEAVEDVPDDSHVCHYDELSEPAKEQFPLLADGSRRDELDADAAGSLQHYDFVKYTDYYSISYSSL